MKESAYEALSKSIRIWPKNREYVKTDPDLVFLRAEKKKFAELIKK